MKLFRDYATLALGQVASRLLGFLAFAWLARRLDPAGYAAVEYVVGLAMLFGTLVEGGLGVVAVRRVAHERAALPRLAARIPALRLMVAVPAVAVMLLAAVWMGRAVVPVELAWLFALGLLAIPWRQEWLLQAEERMTEAALAQFVKAAVFALVVVATVRGPADLALTGVAELASAVVMLAYCMWVQQRAITPLRWTRDLAGMRPVAREAVLAALGTFVLTLQQFIPLFMSAPIAGAEATAWFAAAARIMGALVVFSYLYHYSLYPAVARATAGNDAGLDARMEASFRVTAWAGTFVALALTVLAEPVVILAFGSKLAPAAPVLQVLAWLFPVALSSGHARWGLFARGAQGNALVAQLAGVGVTATVGALLGPGLGAHGFALAAVAGGLTVWIGAHQRLLRMGARPPSPWSMLRPLGAALLTVLAMRWAGTHGWLAVLLLVPYVLVARVLEPRLAADLRLLARTKAAAKRAG